MLKQIKVLWIGDGGTPTGFSTVNHNIIDNLPDGKYDVHHLAINYFGDPTPYKHKMYPAQLGGDLWGYGRLLNMLQVVKPDFIFILNDVWVISRYLEIMKQFTNITLPPIVVYYPVDSTELDPIYFKDFDIVSKAVVYTQFGFEESLKAHEKDYSVIYHGVDTEVFKRLPEPKGVLRKRLFTNDETLQSEDAFIILNANRNQPRKHIDTTIEAFKLFSEGKPANVKLYLHMGTRDAGWDIIRLMQRYGIDNRLVITNLSSETQKVGLERLNLIYNVCDVGVNTSTGEGWGLVSVEHAATGAPQVVGNHSACAEIFGDVGLLADTKATYIEQSTMTRHSLLDPVSVAEKFELLYTNPELRKELGKNSIEKLHKKQYSWRAIAKQWDTLFDSLEPRPVQEVSTNDNSVAGA